MTASKAKKTPTITTADSRKTPTTSESWVNQIRQLTTADPRKTPTTSESWVNQIRQLEPKPQEPQKKPLSPTQRSFQIIAQILKRLQTHRQADERIGDSVGQTVLPIVAGMRHGCGVFNE